MKVIDRINLFKRKFGFEPEAPEVCPRFEGCAVNRCPLHEDYLKLESRPEDKEQRCKVAKAIRKPIGVYFKLKNKGLKERELSGLKRWENLSEEEKRVIRERMKKTSLILRLSKKGYGMSRVKPKQSSITLTKELKTPITPPQEHNSHLITPQTPVKEQGLD